MANDGPQPTETELQKLEREINGVLREFQLEGWHPNANWHPDLWNFSNRMDTLTALLMEHLEMTEEEFGVRFAQKYLENLNWLLSDLREKRNQELRPSVDIFRAMPPHGFDGKQN